MVVQHRSGPIVRGIFHVVCLSMADELGVIFVCYRFYFQI